MNVNTPRGAVPCQIRVGKALNITFTVPDSAHLKLLQDLQRLLGDFADEITYTAPPKRIRARGANAEAREQLRTLMAAGKLSKTQSSRVHLAGRGPLSEETRAVYQELVEAGIITNPVTFSPPRKRSTEDT